MEILPLVKICAFFNSKNLVTTKILFNVLRNGKQIILLAGLFGKIITCFQSIILSVTLMTYFFYKSTSSKFEHT